jgi:protein-tyrosine phosphatase
MSQAPETHVLLLRERRVPLQGVVNFRDLGGYAALDGRVTRWGKIFRSDVLADLTDADMNVLSGIGLRTICDLRSDSERLSKPNRTFSGAAAGIYAIGFMPHRGEELLADAKAGKISVHEIENRVREIYRRFVTDQCGTFARLLELIDTEPLPMLIHCTSGRDRTGFASAALLMAVGVPRATIAEDYALSNQYRRDLTFQIGGSVLPEVMATLTNAHTDYLAASFQAIDEGWGSDADYLRTALGLSEDRRHRLQEKLLERPESAIAACRAAAAHNEVKRS